MKTNFSINDIENITGIKAHTIRIWEKRYNVLQPERSINNTRSYSLESVKKLLNIATLLEFGNKISRIAQLSNEELKTLASEHLLQHRTTSPIEQQLRISMITYNEEIFNDTFESLISKHSFHEIYLNILGPFLENISKLWHTATFTESQIQFIRNLIFEKINLFTSHCEKPAINPKKTIYACFGQLTHQQQLDLAFIHYLLRYTGKLTLNLNSIHSVEELKDIKKQLPSLIFVTAFTNIQNSSEINKFLKEFHRSILVPQNTSALLLNTKGNDSYSSMTTFSTLKDFYNYLK